MHTAAFVLPAYVDRVLHRNPSVLQQVIVAPRWRCLPRPRENIFYKVIHIYEVIFCLAPVAGLLANGIIDNGIYNIHFTETSWLPVVVLQMFLRVRKERPAGEKMLLAITSINLGRSSSSRHATALRVRVSVKNQ